MSTRGGSAARAGIALALTAMTVTACSHGAASRQGLAGPTTTGTLGATQGAPSPTPPPRASAGPTGTTRPAPTAAPTARRTGSSVPTRPAPTRAAPGATHAPSPTAAAAPKGVTHDLAMTSPFRFSPSSLTIAVGDSVRVTNKDSADHTFTDSPVFDSGDVSPGGSYTYRFGNAGTFDFVCSYHTTEQMKGTVTVR